MTGNREDKLAVIVDKLGLSDEDASRLISSLKEYVLQEKEEARRKAKVAALIQARRMVLEQQQEENSEQPAETQENEEVEVTQMAEEKKIAENVEQAEDGNALMASRIEKALAAAKATKGAEQSEDKVEQSKDDNKDAIKSIVASAVKARKAGEEEVAEKAEKAEKADVDQSIELDAMAQSVWKKSGKPVLAHTYPEEVLDVVSAFNAATGDSNKADIVAKVVAAHKEIEELEKKLLVMSKAVDLRGDVRDEFIEQATEVVAQGVTDGGILDILKETIVSAKPEQPVIAASREIAGEKLSEGSSGKRTFRGLAVE